MKHISMVALTATLLFTACKKDDVPNYNSTAKAPLSVEFDNIAGSADLQLNTGVYTNAAGENFTVTKLKYYVSNFTLTKADGSVYVVPKDSCYFLIDESDEETHEPILNVPEGEYKSISFLIGVDSLKSTASVGERTGNLDPASAGADMYRDLNKGYIFFKMEGTSPASALVNNAFMYHIGGYNAATINNIKMVTLDLTQRGTPKVKAGKETNIHLMVDILKMFTGTTNVSIAANPSVMFESYSTSVANNYATMIRHDHTEN